MPRLARGAETGRPGSPTVRDRPRQRALMHAVLIVLLLESCGASAPREPDRADLVTLSIVGTNDLHGHLRALPLLAAHIEALRAARARDGGAVLLLDGGDVFQGTLESNLDEGASAVIGYEALGYDAVAIGNHEFDYGPVGPRATPGAEGDDPRGALKARIAEADFPFLASNLIVHDTGARAELGLPSVLIERAGIRAGVIGVTTEATTRATLPANVADLEVRPLAAAIAEEASSLRARGAVLVIVAAHAGARCSAFEDPEDLSSCEGDEEIFEVARALEPGTIDAIVAGHTHQGVAHRVAGIPIIESYSYGVAFGRIDLEIDRRAGRIRSTTIHAPHRLCADPLASPEAGCASQPYEGVEIVASQRVASALAPAIERAREQRERPLGVILAAPFTHSRNDEGPLGNLFADLMLRARPTCDLAMVNGGGLRIDVEAGPLTYGRLYEAFPFDNRFATVALRGADLRRMIESIAGHDGSFLSFAGLRARVSCREGAIRAELFRADGAPIGDEEPLRMATSDFLVAGGDGVLREVLASPDARVEIEDDPPIRELVALELGRTGGTLDPRQFFDPARPRIAFAAPRPMRCE